MKTKLKLSLLDDYISLSKILVFCNNFSQIDMLNLKLDCQNLLMAINSVFENKKDFSFAVFKQQVFQGVANISHLHFQQNLHEQNILEQFKLLKISVKEKIEKLS